MGTKRRPKSMIAGAVNTLDDLRVWLEERNLIILVDHLSAPNTREEDSHRVELCRYSDSGSFTTLEADASHPDFVDALINAMKLYETDHE